MDRNTGIQQPGVADFLRERAGAILNVWGIRVASEIREVELSCLTLHDIPLLLEELAVWLESDQQHLQTTLIGRASAHVMQRLQAGLSLGQLFNEYRLLRETIIEEILGAETAEQERVGIARESDRIAILVKELAHLNAGLDMVFSRSIEEFVAERDRRDAAEREHAEKEQRAEEAWKAFLLRLSDELRPLADPIEIQSTAMRILGEHLNASGAQYFEADPDGKYLESHGGYENTGRPTLERLRLDDFGTFIADHYRAGHTLVLHDVHADRRISKEMRRSWDQFRVRATVGVPLLKDGKLTAVLGVKDSRPRAWSREDIASIKETIERTWAAVERARIEAALRKSDALKAFLLRLSDALRPISDPIRIQNVAMRVLGEHLDASGTQYLEADSDGEYVETLGGYSSTGQPFVGRVKLADFGPFLCASYRAGRTIVIHDVHADDRIDRKTRRSYDQLEARANVGVPLIRRPPWSQGSAHPYLVGCRYRMRSRNP